MSLSRAGINGNLLESALAYHERGFSIIPTIGKKPGCRWKQFQKERAGPEQLRKWFTGNRFTGLAVILGEVSGGLVCRDFDCTQGYSEWTSNNPELANIVPTSSTHRGYHIYGQGPAGFKTFLDGEFRGDSRHYCLLPPSRHPSGDVYVWQNPLPPLGQGLPLLPESLVSGNQTQEQPQATQQHMSLTACVTTAISRTLPGQRNRRIFDFVRHLKGIPGLDTSPANLELIFAEWLRRATHARTKNWDENWTDFIVAWQSARKPAGAALVSAIAKAREGSSPKEQAIALCAELGRETGRFFLSCQTLAEKVLHSNNRMAAWRLLKVLEFEGVIERTRIGSLKGRRASEFRWIGTAPASGNPFHDGDGPYKEGF